MKRIDFNQPGGLPLSTQILDAMQDAYNTFKGFGNFAGELAIIYGCVVGGGGNVTDGLVFINGEPLYFQGGNISTDVVIVETGDSRGFEDGSVKSVIYTRYATFGTAPESYPWANFRRPSTLFQLEDRLINVEKSVPIGLVAIWDRPGDEIPVGWIEHTDMRGNIPVGHNSGDPVFGSLGNTIGTQSVTLTSGQLPKLQGTFQTISSSPGAGISVQTGASDSSIGGSSTPTFKHRDMKISFGNDEAHTNIQPSRIVKYIRFVGF